jgi:DNA-directed RNA polymerase subunit omega
MNRTMNSELCRQALEKVGNPNVLVNVISRRVRQLNAGGGGLGRPLVKDTTGMGAADIALRELVEGAFDFELLLPQPEGEGGARARKKKKA